MAREPANIKIVQTKNVLTRNKDVTEVKGRKRFSFHFFIAVFLINQKMLNMMAATSFSGKQRKLISRTPES